MRASWAEFRQSFKNSILALILPCIILFGIIFGVFTPTEAGAVAVVYALVVTLFVYKEIRVSELKDVLVSAGLKTAVVMIVVAMASVFAWILARERVPAALVKGLFGLSENPDDHSVFADPVSRAHRYGH